MGSVVMGKELLTDLKNEIFKNWLGTRPKMETNEPNVYPTILGGVSRGFWSPFIDLGARSATFWHLKRGTFAKSDRLCSLTTAVHWCAIGSGTHKKFQRYRPINDIMRTIFVFGLPKVPVFKCQKMAFRAPNSSNGLQKPRETPPKLVG